MGRNQLAFDRRGIGALLYYDAVSALAFFNGELYAGGDLTGATSRRFARWNGTSWVPLAASFSGGERGYVYALAADSSGVYVGGEFTSVAGQTANHIVKWGKRDM